MGDDLFEKLIDQSLIPVIKKRFTEYLNELQSACEVKDLENIKKILQKFFILAKTSKHIVNMDPFEELFDKFDLILYSEGEELKLIRKTAASEILFKKGNET